MRVSQNKPSIQAQRGFSMVEMLMTAFILAVGIMGLTMLQVMSIKAARGGKSLGTAVQVGEMVMDQIELEGRLSWLNLTANQYTPVALTSLQYVNKPNLDNDLKFNINGQVSLAPATDFYSVNFVKTDVAVAGAVGTGALSNFVVQVRFSDQTDQAGVAIPRVVTITRSVLHG
jgi:prepilin-type N-terminal cleavage/methylation domain-containing protein